MSHRRRTMKENALDDEDARIAAVRHREKLRHFKDERAVEILSSSEIARAVISKRGCVPEPG